MTEIYAISTITSECKVTYPSLKGRHTAPCLPQDKTIPRVEHCEGVTLPQWPWNNLPEHTSPTPAVSFK